MKKTLLALTALSLFGAGSAMAATQTFQWAGSVPTVDDTSNSGFFIVPAPGTTDFNSGNLVFSYNGDKVKLTGASELGFIVVKDDSATKGTPDKKYNPEHDKEPVQSFTYTLNSIKVSTGGNFGVIQQGDKTGYFAVEATSKAVLPGSDSSLLRPGNEATITEEGTEPTPVYLSIVENRKKTADTQLTIGDNGLSQGDDVTIQAVMSIVPQV